MKFLFSQDGKKRLEALSFTKTLYAFDFDGTLAPIVSVPSRARASAETERLLLELARLVPVIVISGRSVADLAKRTRLPRSRLIGNHGLEGLGVDTDAIVQAKKVCRKWLKQLSESRKEWGSDPGISIEDKGYSLALHYRRSRSKAVAKETLAAVIKRLHPSPRLIAGKCVFNLIPANGPHKGVALLEAMAKLDLTSSFYIGDDDTDEDVFSLRDDRVLSARVGKKAASQAQFFVSRQIEVNRLLRSLIRFHRAPSVKEKRRSRG